jgi:hypothetical protein
MFTQKLSKYQKKIKYIQIGSAGGGGGGGGGGDYDLPASGIMCRDYNNTPKDINVILKQITFNNFYHKVNIICSKRNTRINDSIAYMISHYNTRNPLLLSHILITCTEIDGTKKDIIKQHINEKLIEYFGYVAPGGGGGGGGGGDPNNLLTPNTKIKSRNIGHLLMSLYKNSNIYSKDEIEIILRFMRDKITEVIKRAQSDSNQEYVSRLIEFTETFFVTEPVVAGQGGGSYNLRNYILGGADRQIDPEEEARAALGLVGDDGQVDPAQVAEAVAAAEQARARNAAENARIAAARAAREAENTRVTTALTNAVTEHAAAEAKSVEDKKTKEKEATDKGLGLSESTKTLFSESAILKSIVDTKKAAGAAKPGGGGGGQGGGFLGLFGGPEAAPPPTNNLTPRSVNSLVKIMQGEKIIRKNQSLQQNKLQVIPSCPSCYEDNIIGFIHPCCIYCRVAADNRTTKDPQWVEHWWNKDINKPTANDIAINDLPHGERYYCLDCMHNTIEGVQADKDTYLKYGGFASPIPPCKFIWSVESAIEYNLLPQTIMRIRSLLAFENVARPIIGDISSFVGDKRANYRKFSSLSNFAPRIQKLLNTYFGTGGGGGGGGFDPNAFWGGAAGAGRCLMCDSIMEGNQCKNCNQTFKNNKDTFDFIMAKVRNFIIDNIINLRCPRCYTVFFDYSGCNSLTCSNDTCKCGFCAVCLKDCGNDAHAHIRESPPCGGDPAGPAGPHFNYFDSFRFIKGSIMRRYIKIIELLNNIFKDNIDYKIHMLWKLVTDKKLPTNLAGVIINPIIILNLIILTQTPKPVISIHTDKLSQLFNTYYIQESVQLDAEKTKEMNTADNTQAYLDKKKENNAYYLANTPIRCPHCNLFHSNGQEGYKRMIVEINELQLPGYGQFPKDVPHGGGGGGGGP